MIIYLNYLYENKEKGIIVSDNKDFVINSFSKKISSLYSEIKLNKIEINELNKGEIIKLRLTHLLLLLNIVNPNTLNSNIFNKKELNSNVENNEQYNWFENMTGINKNKEIYRIENDFLLLLQDKELFKKLVNSNENHDELYTWLYKLSDRILKSYNYEFDTSYIKTLYKLCYEMENKNKKIIQTQNLVSTELVLLNFLLQILSYLKVSDKELIKINEEELKARNEFYGKNYHTYEIVIPKLCMYMVYISIILTHLSQCFFILVSFKNIYHKECYFYNGTFLKDNKERSITIKLKKNYYNDGYTIVYSIPKYNFKKENPDKHFDNIGIRHNTPTKAKYPSDCLFYISLNGSSDNNKKDLTDFFLNEEYSERKSFKTMCIETEQKSKIDVCLLINKCSESSLGGLKTMTNIELDDIKLRNDDVKEIRNILSSGQKDSSSNQINKIKEVIKKKIQNYNSLYTPSRTLEGIWFELEYKPAHIQYKEILKILCTIKTTKIVYFVVVLVLTMIFSIIIYHIATEHFNKFIYY